MARPKVGDTQVAVRVSMADLDRASALVDAVAASLPPGTITRATVLRMALLRGLEALEAEYAPTKPKRSR